MPIMDCRFQICDPVCGLVETASAKVRALHLATSHFNRGCNDVTVYDLMAHPGKPQEFDINGRILKYRIQEGR